MRHLGRMLLPLCLASLMVTVACGRGDRATEPAQTFGVRVTDVTLGRAIGGDRSITDRTESFRPNDTIYASVATDGTAQSATLRARWTFEDGQVVDESTRTITPSGQERTEFHIAKPDGWPAGRYNVEIFLNDQPAERKDFRVQDR
jgi:hypothetical protein